MICFVSAFHLFLLLVNVAPELALNANKPTLNLFNNNNDISNNVIQNLEQELNEFLDIFGLNIPPPRPVTPPTETIFNDISDVNFFNFFDFLF